MSHSVVFHIKRQSKITEAKYSLARVVMEIITCHSDPSIYTMDHPDVIVCSFMKKIFSFSLLSTDEQLRVRLELQKGAFSVS